MINMNYYGVVHSPFFGTIEEISIKDSKRINECEPIFLIKTEHGTIESIQTGMSGEIESLEVELGDEVIPGMVLAYIKEDVFVTGRD